MGQIESLRFSLSKIFPIFEKISLFFSNPVRRKALSFYDALFQKMDHFDPFFLRRSKSWPLGQDAAEAEYLLI